LQTELAYIDGTIKQNPLNTVLCMTDMRNIIFSPKALNTLQNSGRAVAPYIKRMAILGVHGEARRKLLELTMKLIPKAGPTKTFEDETGALDWLVS